MLKGRVSGPEAARSIYVELAAHQRTENWRSQETITWLQAWADRLNVAFKFHIPRLVLNVDRLPCNVLGHFRAGHNGLGLEGVIAINAKYVGMLEEWELLGVLVHEMVHAWQACHGTVGKRSHHNREFRDKARELGLIVERNGVTGYTAESPFKDLLRRFGVGAPEVEIAPRSRVRNGDSKLKKWSCGCTNVWVAVAGFSAKCGRCGNVFVRVDTIPTA